MESSTDGASVRVTVRLHSILRHRHGTMGDRLDVRLPAGSRARDLLTRLGIGEGLEAVVAVNDHVREGGTVLQDGDRVEIIPAIAGG